MEIIKDFVAVICITAMIINDIMCFYGFIFGRDKKRKVNNGYGINNANYDTIRLL